MVSVIMGGNVGEGRLLDYLIFELVLVDWIVGWVVFGGVECFD